MNAKKGTRKDNPRPDSKHNYNKGKKCAQATPEETTLESYVELVDQQELASKMPERKKNKLETNTKTNEQSYFRVVGHGRQNTERRNKDRVVIAE